MGVGFPSAQLKGDERKFLLNLRNTAQQRNMSLMGRVNEYLKPVVLDYERDVVVLTPSGNPTERHLCLAYARKAREIFGEPETLADFWSKKLGIEARSLGLPESRDLLNTIRAKTMKRGGVGYVQPDRGSFPLMADTNRFILAAGAIPVHTWLDGTSDGERAIEELVDVAMNTGAAAINVIPDRNYTPGAKDEKIRNLYEVVELAERRDLIVVEGTEMNSPGQKFVDDFDTDELKPLAPVFLKGAYIVYGHSVLQQQCGLGYTSEWAKRNFGSVAEKNEFYRRVGEMLNPEYENEVAGLSEEVDPKEVLEKARRSGAR